MKNKQTAVEWLKKELEAYGSSSHLNLDWETFDELIKQAKEMEKQQIIDAWEDGHDSFSTRNAEQYYNETYGGEK